MTLHVWVCLVYGAACGVWCVHMYACLRNCVLPAEVLEFSWFDLQGEAFSTVHTVVSLTLTARHHMTGGLYGGSGAGGSCKKRQGRVNVPFSLIVLPRKVCSQHQWQSSIDWREPLQHSRPLETARLEKLPQRLAITANTKGISTFADKENNHLLPQFNGNRKYKKETKYFLSSQDAVSIDDKYYLQIHLSMPRILPWYKDSFTECIHGL